MTAVETKKSPVARRVWRMTSEAPLGEVVDFDPTEATGSHTDVPLKVLDPAPVGDWRGSSFDLLNGVEVRDHSVDSRGVVRQAVQALKPSGRAANAVAVVTKACFGPVN
jgi:hypothetical protein